MTLLITSFSTNLNSDSSLMYRFNSTIWFTALSGLVNASYSVANETLGITSVTQRVYRGFKRDESLMQKIRQQF